MCFDTDADMCEKGVAGGGVMKRNRLTMTDTNTEVNKKQEKLGRREKRLWKTGQRARRNDDYEARSMQLSYCIVCPRNTTLWHSGGLTGKVHSGQQGLKARVFPQRVEPGIHFEDEHVRRAFLKGFFQGEKSGVFLP